MCRVLDRDLAIFTYFARKPQNLLPNKRQQEAERIRFFNSHPEEALICPLLTRIYHPLSSSTRALALELPAFLSWEHTQKTQIRK